MARAIPFCMMLIVGSAVERSFAVSPVIPLKYTLTDLGLPPGSFDYSSPMGINSFGQVVGYAVNNAGFNTFIWTPKTANGTTGTIVDIGIPRGATFPGTPYGINSFGQVVGTYTVGPPYRSHGFLWTPAAPNGTTGAFVDIGHLPGGTNDATVPRRINSTGQIMGYSSAATPTPEEPFGYRIFLWTPQSPNATSGSIVNIGIPGDSFAFNDYGQMAIMTTLYPSNISRNYLWTPTTPNATTGSTTELEPPPGVTRFAAGYVMGESGHVLGSGMIDGVRHQFIWTPNSPNGTSGSFVDMDPLTNGTSASAMNSMGLVVGSRSGIGPFVWTADEGFRDLVPLLDETAAGWTIGLIGLNDAGQLVGTGAYDPDGPGDVQAISRAVLLTPVVPEPSFLGLFGGVMAGLSVTKRLRRRSELR